jgi:monoamine oxidase
LSQNKVNAFTRIKPVSKHKTVTITVGSVCFALAFYCILTLPETHGKDLDFVEE